jgi:hypothetical protein
MGPFVAIFIKVVFRQKSCLAYNLDFFGNSAKTWKNSGYFIVFAAIIYILADI